MPYRAMALVAASLLFATQSYAQTAQSDRMGGGGGGKGAAGVTTVKGAKSNSSDRMGGGGGTKAGGGVARGPRGGVAAVGRTGGGGDGTSGGGAGLTTIQNSKSNTYKLNPQPEPPGSKAK
jgi:hypothetical protein